MCYFPLPVLKGIYHYWMFFGSWGHQMEVPGFPQVSTRDRQGPLVRRGGGPGGARGGAALGGAAAPPPGGQHAARPARAPARAPGAPAPSRAVLGGHQNR